MCGVWSVVCGVRCVVCGVVCLLCGVWCVACGVWCVVSVVWCVVAGCGCWRRASVKVYALAAGLPAGRVGPHTFPLFLMLAPSNVPRTTTHITVQNVYD